MTSPDRRPNNEGGTILLGVLITVILVLGLVFASTTISNSEIQTSRRQLHEIRAYWVAQAAVERSINLLKAAVRRTSVQDPLMGVRNMFSDGAGGYQPIYPFVGEAVTDEGIKAGEFTVTMTPNEITDGFEVVITATGYTPTAPSNRIKGEMHASTSSLQVTVVMQEGPSPVFDSAYFINNWGWLYADTITINGNARTNGQLDLGGYAPIITGQPTYSSVAYGDADVDLIGYVDDNEDGQEDGLDGGMFSSWDIVGAGAVRGNAASAGNQHDFEPAVTMPNLTDLTGYEAEAIASGGQITIGETTITDAVYGDATGEKQNLVLIGTATDPIVISGLVVVRGDVILGGYVEGQGAIYSGGNVYIPGDLRYKNPPTTRRPTSNTEAATEAWLQTNRNADLLGVFARENISVGDITDSTWRSYISSWMSNSLNSSAEDAGEDLIPNTIDGRDGELGTIDDDVLENDSNFTVEYYSEFDSELGLIPPGKSVGMVVPGSGEDIDGDGVYDDTTTIANIDFSTTLNSDNWGGNLPAPSFSFSSIASNAITQLDGVFYTNHAFSLYSTQALQMNGSLVCRNEQLIYTNSLELNYDCRLLGGSGGLIGDFLPRNVNRIDVLSWQVLDYDPNLYVLDAGGPTGGKGTEIITLTSGDEGETLGEGEGEGTPTGR